MEGKKARMGGGATIGAIYRLLIEGWHGRKIAAHLKITHGVVQRYIRRMEQNGQIERITKKPAFYRKKSDGSPPLSYAAHGAPPPYEKSEQARMMPAKFGANFMLIVKHGTRPIGLKFNSRGTATIKAIDGSVPHTFQIHRYKAQLWLHSAAFRGSNPDEIIEKGKAQIMALVSHYEEKLGIILTLSRFYEGEEWVMVSKDMSKATAEDAGIDAGGQLEVGESIHKFADFSHPESFQFNTKTKAINKNSARNDARTHRYIYERLLADLEARELAHAEEADRLLKVMGATADAVVAIRMSQEVLAREIERMKK